MWQQGCSGVAGCLLKYLWVNVMMPGASFQKVPLKRTYVQEESVAQRSRTACPVLWEMENILRGSPGRGSCLCSWRQIEIIKGLMVWFILGSEFNAVTRKNQLSNFRCQKWTHRPWKWEFVLQLYGQTRRQDAFLSPSLNWGRPGSRGRDRCGCGLTAGGRFSLKPMKCVLTVWGQAGAGKQTVSRMAVRFPPVPAELCTLSAGSPASASAGRGRCDLRWGKGHVHPGAGSSPARALDLRARCEAVPSACFARGLSQGSARLTTRPETGEKALRVRRPPADTKRSTPVSTRGAHPLLKGPRKPWPEGDERTICQEQLGWVNNS